MMATATPLTPLQRKRRRMLLWSAPVVLPALVLACKLLSLPLFAGQAATAFAADNGAGTIRSAQGMGAMNLVEPWKAHFARGDGHALAGDYAGAKADFATSLTLVSGPEACKVRVNLVLSLEKLGDAAEKAGDAASAVALFKEGAGVVAQAPPGCFAPQGDGNSAGEGDALKQAAKRLAGKAQQPVQAKDPGKGADGEKAADTPAPPESKTEELQNRNSDAAKKRADAEKQRTENGDAAPKSYGKPW
ncbi:MAG: hypothetical protein WBX27_00165 [Specibacter sp.]